MEPMPQGGDGVDIVIVPVVPVASIFPLGVPRLGVGVGAPRVGGRSFGNSGSKIITKMDVHCSAGGHHPVAAEPQ